MQKGIWGGNKANFSRELAAKHDCLKILEILGKFEDIMRVMMRKVANNFCSAHNHSNMYQSVVNCVLELVAEIHTSSPQVAFIDFLYY